MEDETMRATIDLKDKEGNEFILSFSPTTNGVRVLIEPKSDDMYVTPIMEGLEQPGELLRGVTLIAGMAMEEKHQAESLLDRMMGKKHK
jgi:hypothetical protein